MARTILVTGAGGYVGSALIGRFKKESWSGKNIIAVDVRAVPAAERSEDVIYKEADIRAPEFRDIIADHKPQAVVHLASVVGAGGDPDFDYSVDVLGTENVLKACVENGVEQIVVTSSGAAYGYYADNPKWISETDELRGNEDFAYSRHKRMVEEMLAEYRQTHPALKQLVLRPGTVLGATTDNQITALFAKPFMLSVTGSDSRFVFIWDEDVIAIIAKGVKEGRKGIFNLAGDGALSVKEIACILKKPRLMVPGGLLGGVLNVARLLGLGKLGAEHVKFLKYRPVLDNESLKNDFGYVPKKSTRETLDYFLEARDARTQAQAEKAAA